MRAIKDRSVNDALDRARASRELAAIALTQGRLAEAEREIEEARTASVEAGRREDYLRDVAAFGYMEAWFRGRPTQGRDGDGCRPRPVSAVIPSTSSSGPTSAWPWSTQQRITPTVPEHC